MIFSKGISTLTLFLLLLSCNSEKTEKQIEVVVDNSIDKLETSKQITEDSSVIKEGDIIFQTSTSSQSKAIQLATNSKYSHVGIIVKSDNDKNDFMVLEAVQPVKYTPLKEWIKRGENSHFVIKRLKNADKIVTNEAIQRMKEVGGKFLGKNYDLYFEWSDKKSIVPNWFGKSIKKL